MYLPPSGAPLLQQLAPSLAWPLQICCCCCVFSAVSLTYISVNIANNHKPLSCWDYCCVRP